MKKINCKHELNRKQEIEARRFRKVILEEDVSSEWVMQLLQRVTSLYYSFIQSGKDSLYKFVKENDIVVYSAFQRVGGMEALYHFVSKSQIV